MNNIIKIYINNWNKQMISTPVNYLEQTDGKRNALI